MAITIRPIGGTGNQLFIYATGSAISQRLGVELWADISDFASNQKRSYMLDSFPSTVSRVVDAPDASNRNSLRARFLKSPWANPGNQTGKIVKERGFWFDPQVRDVQDGCTIHGYLQSWKYFQNDSKRLRSEILSPVEPSSWFLATSEKLLSADPWIGIHVRRGDYLEIPRMGITTDYYYSRALSVVTQLTGVKNAVVFSDDINSARALPSLSQRRQTKFLEAPEGSSPLENLILLSLSSHLVSANSSFSWWAGWLNDREERTVVYPRPWIDFRFINDRDLPLPNWIGLGREPLETALTNHVGY